MPVRPDMANNVWNKASGQVLSAVSLVWKRKCVMMVMRTVETQTSTGMINLYNSTSPVYFFKCHFVWLCHSLKVLISQPMLNAKLATFVWDCCCGLRIQHKLHLAVSLLHIISWWTFQNYSTVTEHRSEWHCWFNLSNKVIGPTLTIVHNCEKLFLTIMYDVKFLVRKRL